MLSESARERQKLLNVRLQMISRCHDPKNPQYADYGGRGITVCERWMDSPRLFISDVGPRPVGMTLDRINNDGGYEPDNVRWASRSDQQRNRRGNVYVEIDGKPILLVDACARAGLPYVAVLKRIKRGWPVLAALSVPSTRANRGTPRGKAALAG